MIDDPEAGLADAPKEADSWLDDFKRCVWCADYVNVNASTNCYGPTGRLLRFCDADCRDLWTRWSAPREVVVSEAPGRRGRGEAQEIRLEEREALDAEDHGMAGILWLDALDDERHRPKTVQYWLFIWPRGQVAVVAAYCREEAILALKEVTNKTTRDLRPIPESSVPEYTREQLADDVRR